MNKAILIARILLGVGFVVFGLNFFFKFMAIPKSEGLPAQFMGALFASGALALIKVLEIVGGALVLSKRFAPLGLVILGPIVANILMYDIYLAKAFNPAGTLMLVLTVFLVWAYRKNFAGVFGAPRV